MARPERLRETLLELQFFRDREARILDETQALLECLEAYAGAASPGEALTSVFTSLSHKIGAAMSCVLVHGQQGGVEIAASDWPQIVGQTICAPINLFDRPRNVTDLGLLGQWAGTFDLQPFTGLIVSPVHRTSALMAVRTLPHAFHKDAMNLVERLSGLAVQALRNREIAAENDLLAATIARSSYGVTVADALADDTPLIYANAAFEKMTGYRVNEVMGRSCRFMTAEPTDSPARTTLRQAVRNRTGAQATVRNRRKSGELFWNEVTLVPIPDNTGAIRYIVGAQSDVTERVEATRDRDRARARMEGFLSATQDAFLVLDHKRRVAFTNSAVGDLFPAPRRKWATGTTLADNWADYLEQARQQPGRITRRLRQGNLEALAEMAGPQEVDLPDGRAILLRATALDDGGMVVSATNVTDMKSAQQLLAQRLAAIEAATDGIAVTDRTGRLTYLNPAATTLLGFRSGTGGLGRQWYCQYSEHAPVPAGQAFETTLTRTADGETLTHELTASPLENGGSVIVVRDITESLATEAREQELGRDLIRLQRQEAIAQLTAGVAHDFNNLLSAINGSAALIGMSDNLPQSVRPHLDRITAAGTQSAKLVNRLLDIGAGSEADGVFDLASVLADLSELVRPSLPDGAAFDVRADRSGVALKGTPAALSQVLINLCMNARDAIGSEPGRIEVRVTHVKGRQVPPVMVGRVDDDGRYVCLSVCDSGAGIDTETAASIFKPYFTTKGRMGTGLGLAIVAMQVQSVGGAIEVTSEPGVGTTISVYWPLAMLHRDATGIDGVSASCLAGMTIIVVDDDPDVGHVIAKFLEANGAEVATCEDPRDALTAIGEDPGSWSALVTDYDMPAMNGGELAARVRQIAPDLPIVVVTALARRLTDRRLVDGQVTSILSKPVDLRQLCTTLSNTRPAAGEGADNAVAAC